MSLTLQRIAYCSNATRPELALQTLAEILSRGRFFQVLEGAAQDIDRTLRRIEADRRHRDLQIVMREDVSSRRFGQWAMVAARVTPSRQAHIDAVIDRCADAPADAVDAARALLDSQIAV